MQNESVIIERTYPASIEQVWSAITDPEKMKQWYFPMLEDFKPVPGFETRFVVEMDDKRYPHIWKIVEVVPPRKISYEWKFGGYPGNSLLTWELFETAGGTRLVLTHEHLESFRPYPELSKDNFQAGWTYFTGTALEDYLQKTAAGSAETGMLIRKPIHEVFEAFADPAVTTKFWFTRSTGKLEKGKTVEWTWDMYNVSSQVEVKELIPHQKIRIEWGGKNEERTRVEWSFRSVAEHTFVDIRMYGFTGEGSELLKKVTGSVGGFCWVLAGAKAWLEFGIRLNLVADRYPAGRS